MAIFLSREELYRLIQRELPEFAYPDAGAPSTYWSTADSDATAAVLAAPSGLYGAMKIAYDDQWPQTCGVARLSAWEEKVFGAVATSGATPEQRRDAILTKLRTKNGITAADIAGQVLTVIGSDKTVQLMPWGCGCADGSSSSGCVVGAWFIGVAELGVNTYLGAFGQFLVTGSLACEANPANFGLTPQQWTEIQMNAYGYTLRIYDYVPTVDELYQLEVLLTAIEPARSDHTIESGIPISQYI